MDFKTFSKWLFRGLGFIVLFVVIISLKPITKSVEKNCEVRQGIVASISEGSTYDINFRLRGDDRVYYINRGAEIGLSTRELKEQLLGQEVILKYPKYWTIFDPKGISKHIAKLEFQGQVLYSEMKN